MRFQFSNTDLDSFVASKSRSNLETYDNSMIIISCYDYDHIGDDDDGDDYDDV